jgi:photosystem II stability/assembly factor-like uncharacterized protein
MRAAMAVLVAALILGPGQGPVRAQPATGAAPALRAVHMTDALTGWAVTRAPTAVLRTTDGGIRWRDVTPLEFTRPGFTRQQIVVDTAVALTPLIAWVLSTEANKLFHTVDGGRTWRRVVLEVQSGAFHFLNARDGWMLANEVVMGDGEAVDIYRSTDGGDRWSEMASTTADDESSGLPFMGDKVGLTFVNATTGWIAGTTVAFDSLYLFVTRDGGRTWRPQPLPQPPEVTSPWENWTEPPIFFTAQDGILPVFYTSVNPESYAPVASPAVFYVTHDGGTTWAATTPVSVAECECPWSFADMSHGWVTDGAVLSRTADGGQRWTQIQPAPPFGGVIQLDFLSPRLGWAVSETPPFLLKTADGGRTWVPVRYTIQQ